MQPQPQAPFAIGQGRAAKVLLEGPAEAHLALAAFVGADGISLHVLAKYALAKGTLPDEEVAAGGDLQAGLPDLCSALSGASKGKDADARAFYLFRFPDDKRFFPYYREDALPLTLNEVFHGAEKRLWRTLMRRADHSSQDVDNDSKELSDNIMSMIGFLCRKYDFRYNSVMKCTEYRPKEKDY